MSMDDYFMTVERAYRNVAIPQAYQEPKEYINTTADDQTQANVKDRGGLTDGEISWREYRNTQ